MSMVTRCPACGTGFRVSAEQLKAMGGKVRCGRCSTVFNALDTLSTLPDARTEPSLPPVPAPEPAVAEAAPPAALIEAAPSAALLAEAATATAVREEHREERHETAAGGMPPVTEPEQPPAEHHRAPLATRPGESEPAVPEFPARRRRSGVWAAGSIVLLLVLAAQLTYAYRTEIADARPQARPWLEQVCAGLGCTVPYPHDIQQWSIESSDLQSDPEVPARMTLTAVLRNRASFTQSYPALELTLTDTQDRAVARRVLGAQDYLPSNSRSGPGLAPNAEVTLRLAMDTGDLNAAGYRLYLFYP